MHVDQGSILWRYEKDFIRKSKTHLDNLYISKYYSNCYLISLMSIRYGNTLFSYTLLHLYVNIAYSKV